MPEEEDKNDEAEFFQSLKAGAKSQLEFLYQVDLPEYENDAFLMEYQARYLKFVHLISTDRTLFAVPTDDIDFIWHTHMADSKNYRQFCQERFGFVINHDFSDQDRNEGSKLYSQFQETSARWDSLYHEKMEKPNCMYRGAPPAAFLAVSMIPVIFCCLPLGLFYENPILPYYHSTARYYGSGCSSVACGGGGCGASCGTGAACGSGGCSGSGCGGGGCGGGGCGGGGD